MPGSKFSAVSGLENYVLPMTSDGIRICLDVHWIVGVKYLAGAVKPGTAYVSHGDDEYGDMPRRNPVDWLDSGPLGSWPQR